MTCTKISIGDGVSVTLCTRGSPSRAPCGVCKQARHTKLCDFPLKGKKLGKTCSRKLCDRCVVNVGPDRDLCATHALIAKELGVDTIFADPHPFAGQVVADAVEERGALAVGDNPKEATANFERPERDYVAKDRADWEEFYSERAAIFEYVAGDSRQVAEAKARELAGPRPAR